MGAGVWVAAGSKGLWNRNPQGLWRQEEAPPLPLRLAQEEGRVVVACAGGEVFEAARRRCLTVCPGVEAMALDGAHLYLLSGETDSLLCCRASTGEMLYLNRAGSYPRDMRLDSRGRMLTVAAGAAGEALVFSAPDLRLIRSFKVPGVVWQAVFVPGGLAVMTAVEEGQVFTLLGGIWEQRGIFQQWARMPGLPGALCLCRDGTLTAASSECLLRCRPHPFKVLWQYRREGLPQHLSDHGNSLLLSDPLQGRVSLITEPGSEQTLFEGEEIFAQWQV